MPTTQVLNAQVTADLSTCDREPIHIPGSIQPHGALLVLDPQRLTILQASANVQEYLGLNQTELAESSFEAIFGPQTGEELRERLRTIEPNATPVYAATVCAFRTGFSFHALAHRYDGVTILEFEQTESEGAVSFHDLHSLVSTFLTSLSRTTSTAKLTQLAAEEVRRLTNFERVLVYQFDANWHGHVISEALSGDLQSFLDLWFPASDIPQQARKLYEQNRIRLIADANYRAVPIVPADNPLTGRPLDLSLSTLRSVSPVHIEYLHNMGLASSMSISLLDSQGKLWGLISCHHREPKVVPFEVRAACDVIGQALSVRLEANEQRERYEERLQLHSVTGRLLSLMTQNEHFVDGLVENPNELLQFASAQGAAVLFEDQCRLIGTCPEEEDVRRIVDWLFEHGREQIFSSDCFPSLISDSERYRERASGLLGISISQVFRSYILWFRPEVVQTVTWGGDPRKPVEQSETGEPRISPRKSFEAWKETVRGRSLPFTQGQLESASELRNAIISIVLRKAEELGQLAAELQRSNKELEAFTYSVSHDLRAPFRHIVGYSELLKQAPIPFTEEGKRYIDIIKDSAQFAGTLVDNLLSFSKVGRAKLDVHRINMNRLLEEARRSLESEMEGRDIVWHIDELPEAEGDLIMLRLVWQNLLHNAVKYTRSRKEAVIRVSAEAQERELVYSIADNGVGFDQAYVEKLFGVFQRLHKMEEFEGTGIGLAHVRRIIARHGGNTWARGEVDRGATFYFSLPRKVQPDAR